MTKKRSSEICTLKMDIGPRKNFWSPQIRRQVSAHVTCCPSSFLITSFRILSLLDLPSIFRSQLIFATSILLSSSFLRHQHSDPYIITGMTTVPYSFTLVAVVMLFDLHTLFIVPNIAEASPILRLMSFVQRPSSAITPPKYTDEFGHLLQGFSLYDHRLLDYHY